MRITKEMWDKSASEKYFIGNRANGTDYHLQVMRNVCKKNVYMFQIPRDGGYEDYTEEELKKLEAYIMNELTKKFKLFPYGYRISAAGVGKLGFVLAPSPGLLLGDDIVIRLLHGIDEDEGREEINLPSEFYYTSDAAEVVYDMMKNIINFGKNLLDSRKKESGKINVRYSIATTDPRGINTSEKLVVVDRIDLDEFNEDLPDSEINSFLESDKSGILVFHGEPGCGKTSYIKRLISQHKDMKFVYCSLDIIQNSALFRNFVIENAEKKLVIITEDCETILKSRGISGATNIVSDILNISNGLIGDFTKTKFIFTFNMDTKQIDEAILRDGRLACEYEFRPLQGEKLINLANKLGKEVTEEEIRKGLTLANIYRDRAIRCIEKRKKVGFV
jgi:hypothetical protein